LIGLIGELNRDSTVHGILLQLPVPAHLNPDELIAAIDPDKDVDGLHPVNAGRLFQGRDGLRPCTPMGVMRLLAEIGFEPAGTRAVIVGRSNVVGKPMAMLLLAANATTTICHRRSDVPSAVRQADLVVAAVGAPRSIQGIWIKPGAVVIDVGINRVGGKLVGDVEFEEARERASFITPVPGGVGAVTVAMLMHNTFLAWAGQQRNRQAPANGCWPEAGPGLAPSRPAWGAMPGLSVADLPT
jgi:methylenetetrahydrofolate dehydrogenase (NADP+)/methenyltetrahydrofolate cyclohydrolase